MKKMSEAKYLAFEKERKELNPIFKKFMESHVAKNSEQIKQIAESLTKELDIEDLAYNYVIMYQLIIALHEFNKSLWATGETVEDRMKGLEAYSSALQSAFIKTAQSIIDENTKDEVGIVIN